jgi:hypothetical protein
MQVTTVRHDTSGNLPMSDTTKFGFANNGHMFSLMTSKIYNNPVGSIVRELSSNAYDAHVMAGHPERPFRIHVPNVLEPFFEIQDFGVGMSHEQMQQVYTMLGVSTKTDSNTQIGGFGLGSKTPLAYTMQFMVTSIHEGVRREYIVVNDGEGPELSLINEEPTDDHPGMTIQFGVDQQDFRKFESEILRQLRFFAVKPITTNVDLTDQFFDIDAHIDRSIEGATIYKADANLTGVYIVQGGVGYPLNLSEIDNVTEAVRDAAHLLSRDGTALWFDIGQIAPSVNRESIHYNKQTQQNIVSRLTTVAKRMSEEFVAEAETVTPMLKRAIFLNDAGESMRAFAKMHPRFKEVFPPDVMNVETKTVSMFFKNMPTVTIGTGEKQYTTAKYTTTMYIDRRRGTRRPGKATIRPDQGEFQVDSVFFVRDTKKQPIARLTEYWKDNNRKHFYCFENDTSVFTDAQIAEISNALGGVEIRRLSELPEIERPVREASDRGPYTAASAWQWHPDCGYECEDARDWEKITDDLDDVTTAVYIVVHRRKFEDNIGDVWKVLAAKMAGLIDEDIYAVNRKTAGIIEKDDDDTWISLSDILKRLEPAMETIEANARAYRRYSAILRGITVPAIMDSEREQWEKGVKASSPLHRLVRANRLINKRQQQMDKRTTYLKMRLARQEKMRISDEEQEKCRKLGAALSADVNTRYPLLQHIVTSYGYTTTAVNAAIDYVNMIEEREGA